MDLLRKYFHRTSRASERAIRDLFLRFLKPSPTAIVLDIGCGGGEFSKRISDKVGAKHFYAVELLSEYAHKAREKGLSVVLANVDAGLPFRDSSFTIVVSNQVIEHVNSTDNFIAECYRVLKSGGICVISTPNLASFHNIVSLALGFQPPITAVSDEVICGNPLDPCKGEKITSYRRHRRVFTAPSLRALFKFHGFKIKELTGIGLHPLPSIISKRIRIARYSHFLVIKTEKP